MLFGQKPPKVQLVQWLSFNASTVTTESGCIEWVGPKLKDGYGRPHFGGKSVLAHRLAYEWMVGEIPEGYEVHHFCENPACVNPKHLGLFTHLEHMALKWNGCCAKGHPMSGDNLLMEGKKRRCKICTLERKRKYRLKDPEKWKAYYRDYYHAHLSPSARGAMTEQPAS